MLGETGIRSIISRSLAAELSTISCTKYNYNVPSFFSEHVSLLCTWYLVLGTILILLS